MSRSYSLSVGVDISKNNLDVNTPFKFRCNTYKNDTKGIDSLVKILARNRPDIVVLEATGGYERRFVTALHAADIKVHIANPYRVREFARGMGYIAKTDAVDAQALAEYGLKKCPDPTPAPDANVEAIDELRNRYRQLIDIRSSEKARLDQAPDTVKGDIQEHIRWLNNKILSLEKRIAKMIQDIPTLKEKASILRSAPGVGPATQAALIAGLPELGTIGHKQINALVGVAPFARDSGRDKGKRFIKGGRAHVRTALYMAVLTAVRTDSEFKAYYQRLLAAGKAKKLALTACIRKLINMLNAMLRDQRSWSPDPTGA